MEHYVTLFDRLFLPQGLALHRSMERHAGKYRLWILCVDDEVHRVLARLDLPNVRLLRLEEIETAELIRVKATRSRREYCWTLTPFAPRFVFAADRAISRVTYLDADMWLRKNPGPIFSEFDKSGKHVLITDHAYAPEYDQSQATGQYCVQFISFTRDGGEIVRKYWEERCIEWCYARAEGGKFGDQKYLDDWPARFPSQVHVLEDEGLILAPWNAARFPFGRSIAYHFHGLRILSGHEILLSDRYYLPPPLRQHVYGSYLAELNQVLEDMSAAGVAIEAQDRVGIFRRIKCLLRDLSRAAVRVPTLRTGRLKGPAKQHGT